MAAPAGPRQQTTSSAQGEWIEGRRRHSSLASAARTAPLLRYPTAYPPVVGRGRGRCADAARPTTATPGSSDLGDARSGRNLRIRSRFPRTGYRRVSRRRLFVVGSRHNRPHRSPAGRVSFSGISARARRASARSVRVSRTPPCGPCRRERVPNVLARWSIVLLRPQYKRGRHLIPPQRRLPRCSATAPRRRSVSGTGCVTRR